MAASLEYRLSGGGANSDHAAALGGAMSSVSVTADAIFDTVSAVEAAAGDTEYRCVYIRNNGTMTLDVVSLYVSDTPTTGVLAIALGGEGIGGTAETVANENTAPSGESFSTPTTSGTGLTAGPLAVGEARPMWLRRTITAGAGGIALGSNSAAISAYLEYVP